MLFETEVKDIIVDKDKIKGVKVHKIRENEDSEIYADHVVLAVGRKGASWLSDLCKEHNIETKMGIIDIGIRYELPDKTMEKINECYMEKGYILSKVDSVYDDPDGVLNLNITEGKINKIIIFLK